MFKLNMLKMFLMYYIDYNIKIIIQFQINNLQYIVYSIIINLHLKFFLANLY